MYNMDITVSVTFEHSALDAFNSAFATFIGGGKKVATKKKTVEPDEDAEEEEIDEDTDAADDITLEDIRDLVKEKVGKGKKEKVTALLTKFKAKTTSDLKEEKYKTFYDQLKAIK